MEKIKGISFFCPAYYDGGNISHVVNKAVRVFTELCEDYEIIVVNDGSPDNTGEVLDGLASIHEKMKVIHHPRNLGYAQALKTGLINANRFEFILFTDGDNQYDVGYFREMIGYMKDYDAVITYRTRNGNSIVRRFISWVFNRVLNIMFGQPYKDLSSAFRLVKRRAFSDIKFVSTSIFLPVEAVLRIHKKNYKIKEIPIQTRERMHGRSTSLLPKSFIGVVIDMVKVRLGYF
ncbi:MAG: hypothetical protein A2Z72_03020 [Omnitrophica bacterium RBG_13_46_9]|nr:MAG: hypothetical protein A2Z72_03020 [Omnitrophica bacterium RBG_13_46_9]